jgi:hypothetical protein
MPNASRKGRRHDPIPDFPIDQILRELGADDVPTGFGWVRICCPFHDDRTASAGVNHEKGGFRCHSCGVGGDAIGLLQSQLGLTFKEALERAKEITGISAGERKSKTRRASDLLKGGL